MHPKTSPTPWQAREALGLLLSATTVLGAFGVPLAGVAVQSLDLDPVAQIAPAPSLPVVHLAMSTQTLPDAWDSPDPVPHDDPEADGPEDRLQEGGIAADVAEEDADDVVAAGGHRAAPMPSPADALEAVPLPGAPEVEPTEEVAEVEADPKEDAPRRSLASVLADAGLRRAPRPAPRAGRKDRCLRDHEGIEMLQTRHWSIERDLVKRYTSSLKQLNSLGWSHAYKDDENGVRGWRIGGFGCDSPLYVGGLRHKDVIQQVNGHKTNTVAQLIGIWMGWKRTKDFEIVVWRRGRTVTLRYTMV